MPVNVRLGWNSMDVVNTLAYYNAATLTVVKKFIVQDPKGRQFMTHS
jgi:hypothetical protein